ncbi:DUF4376 domain-containing protein [Pseudomonas lundensis]|uniref:DUF4376 domain-containing protein n=1 Tax=Pseudomonas lundensis TaxID=86185 RepID=UPI0014744675|nr:DUF4376 domain-containing protein [Pseudomonas lundensis]NNA16798.1 DUF4376 domain-containing protein [Pseudomonas lundensis]
MNYGTVKEGIITAPLAMCSSFEGVGAWHTLTDAERAEYGWYPCVVLSESYSALTQSRSELPTLTFDGATVTATYLVVDKALATVKSDLLATLAAYRFDFEVGGLELADGLRLLTDRESQSQLSNAFVTLKHGLIPDTDWKGSNGWQLVDLVQIEPIAKAVAAHGRGCFRGERQVQTLINEAATIADLEAIDIASLFDAAYREAYAEVMAAEQATE